jgi:uncharacterized membrane protein YdjX (TVP38/TMEM64 family)
MKRLILLIAIGILVAAFFAFDLGRFLTLDALKAGQATFAVWYDASPWLVAGAYFLIYVAVTALSLPGAAVMTLAGGALFGLGIGTLLVSFASSIGATLAFLVSRFLLRDWVQQRYGERLAKRSTGDGEGRGLLSLHPAPGAGVSLLRHQPADGAHAHPTRTFYWVSQVGMLAGTLVYVNAGTQLAELESLSGILSPGLLASFALLGVFPLLAKRLVAWMQARKVYAGWTQTEALRPQPGGDRRRVRGSRHRLHRRRGQGQGHPDREAPHGGRLPQHRLRPIQGPDPHRQAPGPVRRAEELGIRSATRRLRLRRGHGAGAAGGEDGGAPRLRGALPLPGGGGHPGRRGSARPGRWRSAATDGALQRLSLPAPSSSPPAPAPGAAHPGDRGGGLPHLRHPVGPAGAPPSAWWCWGAGPSAASWPRPSPAWGPGSPRWSSNPAHPDPRGSGGRRAGAGRFRAEGIEVLTEHKAKRFLVEGGEKVLIASTPGRTAHPLRRPAGGGGPGGQPQGLWSGGAGPPGGTRGGDQRIPRDRYPNIYAVGDVAGPYQFTHTASHQAWYAAVNALFGGLKRFKADYRVIPWVTFTSPEVARVGLSEEEAGPRASPMRSPATTSTTWTGPSPTATPRLHQGHHGPKGKDRILGATIVGRARRGAARRIHPGHAPWTGAQQDPGYRSTPIPPGARRPSTPPGPGSGPMPRRPCSPSWRVFTPGDGEGRWLAGTLPHRHLGSGASRVTKGRRARYEGHRHRNAIRVEEGACRQLQR